MTRSPIIALFLAATLARPAAAQCPDGTPPPCGRPAVRAPAPAANSVAVLYFDNRSRDSADAYLADGLTEELIVRLQQVRRLEVKSRYESQRFRASSLPPPAALGRMLNAAYLVTGSVQKAGNRVRLRVELVRAATGATVWSDAPERASDDILTLETEIASQVATAIAGRLLPAERTTLAQRPTRSPEAFDLLLRARHAANQWSEQDPRAALEYLDRAIALDSSFAEAYALKAVAWTTLSDAFILPRDGFERARDAARHALSIDSTLALGYAMLSSAAIALEYDAREALRLAERGVALDPRPVWPRLMWSMSLLVLGRRDEAVVQARAAFEADTLDAIGAGTYATVLFYTGRFDAVDPLLPRLRGALSPDDMRIYDGLLRYKRGDYAGAAERLDWRYYGGYLAAEYTYSLVALGRRDAARAVLDSLLAARRGPNYQNPWPIARAALVLGDTAQALDWLERAFQERTQWLALIDLDDMLAPLRTQPRYLAIRRAMRF